MPLNAVAVDGECSFDRSLCGWKNMSLANRDRKLELTNAKASASPLLPKNNQANHPLGHRLNQGESITWRLASPNSRPSNLQDHTFRAPSKCISHSIHRQFLLPETGAALLFAVSSRCSRQLALSGILIRILNNESMNQETRFFLSPIPKTKRRRREREREAGVQSRGRRWIATRSAGRKNCSLWTNGRREEAIFSHTPTTSVSSFPSSSSVSLYCITFLATNSLLPDLFLPPVYMESYSMRCTNKQKTNLFSDWDG